MSDILIVIILVTLIITSSIIAATILTYKEAIIYLLFGRFRKSNNIHEAERLDEVSHRADPANRHASYNIGETVTVHRANPPLPYNIIDPSLPYNMVDPILPELIPDQPINRPSTIAERLNSI